MAIDPKWYIFSLFITSTSQALAQESVESLMAKGAVRLNAAEVRAQIVGMTTEGPSLNNPNSMQERRLDSDGTYQNPSLRLRRRAGQFHRG